MKLFLNSLKTPIAGGKLSHLVQKDKIWNHGSMVEQVKNVFYHVEKAKNKHDAETVKKYLTAKGFEKLKTDIKAFKKTTSISRNSALTEISIIHVRQGKKEKSDSFKASLKGKRKVTDDLIPIEPDNRGIENFSEEWLFVRKGEWWLLDDMR